MSDAHTVRLAELRARDSAAFGGKSATLGELIAAGIPVPPGFAVSTSAFRAFVEEARLRETIAQSSRASSPDDVDTVGAAARAIGAGDALGAGAGRAPRARSPVATPSSVRQPPVAVRSSALGEDSSEATFAGQQETYLWVRGAEAVCAAVRDCWASLYSAPAIAYRARLGWRRRAGDGRRGPG